MRRLLVLTLVFLVAASRSSTPEPTLYYVKIERKGTAQVTELARQGFDIGGVDLEKEEITVLADAVGLKQLQKDYKVKHFETPGPEEVSKSFKTPDDIARILAETEKNYPRLARVSVAGKSVEGRNIYAIRLTDSFFGSAEGKPTILFDAMHHAREIMTPEVALDIIDTLTSTYKTDPQVRDWMRRFEIWVVPMVNPDGNNRVWNQSPMWRKNLRGGYGVDVNRNYPHGWGSCQGSSGSPNSQTYRGAAGGSEPETQALMALAKKIRPVTGISYHSFSELVLYPFGCPGENPSAADQQLFKKMGAELAAKHKRDSGNGTYTPGTPYELLYAADGGSFDWLYSETGMIAFAVELNSAAAGFRPSFAQWRDSTVERAREGWKYLLGRASGPSLHVHTKRGQHVFLQTETGESVQRKVAGEGGTVHFIVEPGRYRVSGKDFSKNVQVHHRTAHTLYVY